jgi:hypothetical protein
VRIQPLAVLTTEDGGLEIRVVRRDGDSYAVVVNTEPGFKVRVSVIGPGEDQIEIIETDGVPRGTPSP